MKAAIEAVPPVTFSFVRFGLAGLLLLGLLRWREGSIGLPRRDLATIALLGAVGFGVYQNLWSTALRSTTAGNSALLVAFTPIPTALIAAAIGSDVLTPTKLLGALVSFAGVVVVVAAGHGLTIDQASLGDLLTLAGALCWACYVAFGAPFLRRHSPLRATTWAVLAGTVVMAPLGLGELRELDPGRIGPGTLLALLYSAGLAAGVANVVIFHAIRLLGPTRITMYQFLSPAITVVLAFLVLGEPILLAQVVGGAVIVGGILVARAGRLARPRAAHPV